MQPFYRESSSGSAGALRRAHVCLILLDATASWLPIAGRNLRVEFHRKRRSPVRSCLTNRRPPRRCPIAERSSRDVRVTRRTTPGGTTARQGITRPGSRVPVDSLRATTAGNTLDRFSGTGAEGWMATRCVKGYRPIGANPSHEAEHLLIMYGDVRLWSQEPVIDRVPADSRPPR